MKPWYKSKTILFNMAATLAAFAAGVANQFAPFMSPTVFLTFSTVVGAANVALRFITTQPLSTDKE